MIAENVTEFHPIRSATLLGVALFGACLLVAMLAEEAAKRNERGR